MPDNMSSRHQLPYLVVAQAQKELTHNEAIARIDALLHPVVQSRLSSPPSPALTDAGKCWLVDVGAAGEWQDKAHKIAVWAGGSWRFVAPVPAMRIRNIAAGTDLVWNSTAWIAAPIIADPQIGSVIDAEARVAITALLAHFRTIGQITS